jgi:hypothetical protein
MAFKHASRVAAGISLAAAIAACGAEQADPALNQTEAAVPTEADASALADEAAAAEAADTNMFGGNAAAGQTGNGF